MSNVNNFIFWLRNGGHLEIFTFHNAIINGDMLRYRGWKVLNMAALTYPSGWIAAVVFLRRLAWNQLTARSVAPRCLSDWIEKFEFPSLSPSQAATRGHAKAKQHRNIGKRKYLITGVRNSGHHSQKGKYLFGQVRLPGKIPENLKKSIFSMGIFFACSGPSSEWLTGSQERAQDRNIDQHGQLQSAETANFHTKISPQWKCVKIGKEDHLYHSSATSQNFLFPKI